MESIGQILKAAREHRQISIADVVVATKMTSTFVKAIEANDFDALVAPVYARGFIKLYAECVGLDPMPLQKQFDVSRRAVPAIAPPPSEAPPMKASVAYVEKLKSKSGQEKIGRRSKAFSPAALATASPLRVDAPTPIPSRSPSWLASLLAGRLSALNRMFSARVQWPRFKLPSRPACNLAAADPPAPARPDLRRVGATPNVAGGALRAAIPARNATHPSATLRVALWASSVVGGWAGSTACPPLPTSRRVGIGESGLRSSVAGRVFPYLSLLVIVWRRIFIVALVVLLIIAASLAWEWSHRGLPSTPDACRWLAEPPAPYLSMEARPPTPGR